MNTLDLPDPMPAEKRSMEINGRLTSLAFQPDQWDELATLAKARGLTLSGFISGVEMHLSKQTKRCGLSSYLRNLCVVLK